ncbi:MFS transporter [Acetobacterium paludosum]|uniref:MFS transporter n=1 Tax=Acetobacterium paludosum TaxID=52693 RepID=A0A923HYK0_9FIRM|nr:MFS transporter [Acetobacterium paludosum]MBC3888371.1 MFS transporter [Acetobacterium paludosum]
MINIASRIDQLPMTPMLKKILLLTGIGWMFDAMDQGMVSGVMAAIGKEWVLSTGQIGLLGSIGMLGMILGAALSGMAADKWGRKSVIMWTLVIYGIASILSGFAVNFTMLLILRFLTGFGLGGELPAASTLVSEYSPTKIRGRNVIILESFWAWGWIIAAFVAYMLIPVYGWRIAFFVGGVPALFAAFFRMAVPESPRYLLSVGKTNEAEELVMKMEKQANITSQAKSDQTEVMADNNIKASFFDLWSKKYIRSTIVLWVIWFGINFGYYGFVLWTPSLLVARGFDLTKSFEFTLIMCLAQLPGYFSAAYLVEKVGRKKVLAIYFAGTALSAWLFGQAGSVEQILMFGSMLYFFSLGAWGCVYAYTPEVYPTLFRAAGAGWAAAFGRIGAFIAPFIVPVIYSYYGTDIGYRNVFIMLTLVFAIVTLVVILFGKETMGKSLEEISGDTSLT